MALRVRLLIPLLVCQGWLYLLTHKQEKKAIDTNKKINPRELSSSPSYIESVDYAYDSKDSIFLKNINNPAELKMPSKATMAKSLGKSFLKTAKAAVKGDKVVASSELALQRASICRACPWFEPKGQRCAKCGCVVPLKVYFEEEECPIKKW